MESIQHPPKGTPIAPSLSSIAIGVTFGTLHRSRTRNFRWGSTTHAGCL